MLSFSAGREVAGGTIPACTLWLALGAEMLTLDMITQGHCTLVPWHISAGSSF